MRFRRALLFALGFIVGVLASTLLPITLAELFAEIDGIQAEIYG